VHCRPSDYSARRLTPRASLGALRYAFPAARKPWVAIHDHPRDACVAPFQAFYVAALPVCYGDTVVETLDATPGKGSDFDRFAGHLCNQLF
jgi:hypothetical protein